MRHQRRYGTLLPLLLSLIGSTAWAMDFELRPVPHSAPERAELLMSGTVRGTELDQLKTWLIQHPEIDTILLKNSNGGNAAAGYAVGEFIREKGLNTGLIGRCVSSCSRMFLGGHKRYYTTELPPEKTMIGFHGNYGPDGQLLPQRSQNLKAWLVRHFGWTEEQRQRFEPFVDRWVNIPTNKGMVYFFDKNQLKTPAGASVVLCSGNEDRTRDWPSNCESLIDLTARSIGLISE